MSTETYKPKFSTLQPVFQRARDAYRAGDTQFRECVGGVCVNADLTVEPEMREPSLWAKEFAKADQKLKEQIVLDALSVYEKVWTECRVPDQDIPHKVNEIALRYCSDLPEDPDKQRAELWALEEFFVSAEEHANRLNIHYTHPREAIVKDALQA